MAQASQRPCQWCRQSIAADEGYIMLECSLCLSYSVHRECASHSFVGTMIVLLVSPPLTPQGAHSIGFVLLTCMSKHAIGLACMLIGWYVYLCVAHSAQHYFVQVLVLLPFPVKCQALIKQPAEAGQPECDGSEVALGPGPQQSLHARQK